MATYENRGLLALTVTYKTRRGVVKRHIVQPGQRFTYDERQGNGKQISQQCAVAEMVQV